MDLKLEGNSDYLLKLTNEHEKPSVLKYAYEKDTRLLKSAWKQGTFQSKFFKTPSVTYVKDESNQSSFLMDYIPGNSFVEFFTHATKSDLDLLLNKIHGYFSETIKEESIYPIKIFHDKLHEIEKSGYDFILDDMAGIKMYVGECHGDMTFSNMIFSDNIYLIDFLDSYIESPTMDLIKLRQDTHLYYSLNMVKKKNIDILKIKMCLNYIDDSLTSTYKIEHYNSLQIINIFRIYPYVKTKKLEDFLSKKIKQLLQPWQR